VAIQTTRFGVRPFVRLNGEPKRFEVFDRRTGETVVSRLRRDEAECEARRRNHDDSGPLDMMVRLNPLQLSALRNAVECYMFLDTAGREYDILEDLYHLFASWHLSD
jgi:hypothetical protein